MTRAQTEMCASYSLQSNDENDLFFQMNMTGVEIKFVDRNRGNLQVFSQANVTKASTTIPQGHLSSFAETIVGSVDSTKHRLAKVCPQNPTHNFPLAGTRTVAVDRPCSGGHPLVFHCKMCLSTSILLPGYFGSLLRRR